jgi:hypothetical protein
VKCEKHDWDWDISDPTGCPVCYGESLERERVVKLLEGRTNGSGSVLDETGNSIADLSDLIALIKGDNSSNSSR